MTAITLSTFQQVAIDQQGLLLVDKPVGPTSHYVVSWARRQFGVKTIGHTGTLDPLASGLMILLVGRSFTKQQINFLKQDKTYLVTGQLGITSDSYDSTGKITDQSDSWKKITKIQLTEALKTFVGQINQTVPLFSAVKVNGKKLYQLARNGQSAQSGLPIKSITIYSITLLNFSPPHFSIEVFCSSGTYIRSLIHDIGQKIGVGAVVTALRRIQIGEYSVDQTTCCPYFRQLFNRG